MTKPLRPADYFENPERAVALLNKVISGGGDLATIQQALTVVALALKRAGYCEPVPDKPSAPRQRGH